MTLYDMYYFKPSRNALYFDFDFRILFTKCGIQKWFKEKKNNFLFDFFYVSCHLSFKIHKVIFKIPHPCADKFNIFFYIKTVFYLI